ncbi:MAG: hypothetical protein M3Y65_16080 [Pseudomonadota bacterium]|nr:hypothetical protein [Pseudomonadota bacterium]
MTTENPTSTTTTISSGAIQARRAMGGMFFAVFGGVWLEAWAIDSARPLALQVVIGVLALALTWLVYITYRRHAAALAAQPTTAQTRRIGRQFHAINGGQWILIIILANVLTRHGLGMWVIPMVIFIVGLHFFPLAYIFSNRPHYVTGAALVALAAVYPFVASGGPADAVGALGTGLILWASAGWAIRRS